MKRQIGKYYRASTTAKMEQLALLISLETSGIQILFFVVRVILVFEWQKRPIYVDRFLGQLLQDLHSRNLKDVIGTKLVEIRFVNLNSVL